MICLKNAQRMFTFFREARGEVFALFDIPHPYCVLNLFTKVGVFVRNTIAGFYIFDCYRDKVLSLLFIAKSEV